MCFLFFLFHNLLNFIPGTTDVRVTLTDYATFTSSSSSRMMFQKVQNTNKRDLLPTPKAIITGPSSDSTIKTCINKGLSDFSSFQDKVNTIRLRLFVFSRVGV